MALAVQQETKKVLAQKIKSGVSWQLLSKLIRQLFSWGITFYVIRLLEPSDYGIVAITSVLVTFMSNFSELGMGAAIINFEKIGKKQLKQVFTMSLLVNLLLFSCIFVSAPFISDFYDNQNLTDALRVTALYILISIFFVVPNAFLYRKLMLKEKAIIDVGSGMIEGLVALTLAINGYGYWSLIIAALVSYSSRALMYCYRSGFFIGLTLNFSNIKSMLVYGGFTSINRALVVLCLKIDVIIVAKLMGTEKAGSYNVAHSLTMMPLDKVGEIINQVGLSGFSKARNDENGIEKGLSFTIGLLALIAFPVFWGIASIASYIELFILGGNWSGVGNLIAILCLLMPFRVLGLIVETAINSLGKPHANGWLLFLQALLNALAVILFYEGGLEPVCKALVIAYLIYYFVQSFYLSTLVKNYSKILLKRVLKPFISGVLMYVILQNLETYLEANFTGLLCTILIGSIVYFSLVLILLNYNEKTEILKFIKA